MTMGGTANPSTSSSRDVANPSSSPTGLARRTRAKAVYRAAAQGSDLGYVYRALFASARSQHERRIAPQLGLIFLGKRLERMASLVVHHHSGKAAAAFDLPLKLILIHWSRRYRLPFNCSANVH
jgi:hypothetical protein